MRRRPRLVICIALALVMFLTGFVTSNWRSNDVAGGVAGAASNATGPFYLDLGGSASLGVQPTGVPSRNGQQTIYGYADDLVRFETKNDVDFVLNHDGCPGMTVVTLIATGPQQCDVPTPQLVKAEDFLTANRDSSGLVTIDAGFNDVRPCLRGATVNEACVTSGLADVANDLPTILQKLQSAAGHNVTFVGIGMYDPFLADYLIPPESAATAQSTLVDINRLNATLKSVYTAAGMQYADVPSAFDTGDAVLESLPNVGAIPVNVEQVCQLTWMCQPAPFGPDDHPNNAGYMVIAEAIADVLPGAWKDEPVK
jgi:lysophospholipase L1-like esterase